MNKNISIWRGSNTPPTLNHLWIDGINNIKININNEWVSLFDSNLKEFLLEYMNNKEYEIHDERIREVTSADAGKVVKVDAEGKLVIE